MYRLLKHPQPYICSVINTLNILIYDMMENLVSKLYKMVVFFSGRGSHSSGEPATTDRHETSTTIRFSTEDKIVEG